MFHISQLFGKLIKVMLLTCMIDFSSRFFWGLDWFQSCKRRIILLFELWLNILIGWYRSEPFAYPNLFLTIILLHISYTCLSYIFFHVFWDLFLAFCISFFHRFQLLPRGFNLLNRKIVLLMYFYIQGPNFFFMCFLKLKYFACYNGHYLFFLLF